MRRIAACSVTQRMVCVIAIMMGVTAAAGAHGMGSIVQEAQPGPASTLTIGDLLKGVEQRESAVQDLTVSYRYDYAESEPVRENAIPRTHQTVTTKGQMFLISRRTWSYTPSDPSAMRRSFDGRFATVSTTVKGGWATISDKRTEVAEMPAGEFHRMMMLHEPRPNVKNGGRDDQSLISLLQDPNARVRPMMEEINGHMTHVVELKRENTDQMLLEVWIDPERGYLPIKQLFYQKGEPMMRYEMEEAVEVWNQSNIETWYMTKGTKWVVAFPEVAGMETDSNWVLEVDGWETDEPQIVANTSPTDESFRIWQDLPENTFLRHLESGMRISEDALQGMKGEFGEATQTDEAATESGAAAKGPDGGTGEDANGVYADGQSAGEGDGAEGFGEGVGAQSEEGSSSNGSGRSIWWYVGGAAALLVLFGAARAFRRVSA